MKVGDSMKDGYDEKADVVWHDVASQTPHEDLIQFPSVFSNRTIYLHNVSATYATQVRGNLEKFK